MYGKNVGVKVDYVCENKDCLRQWEEQFKENDVIPKRSKCPFCNES